MIQGMDLHTLATTVIEHASGKEDLLAPAQALRFGRNDSGSIRLAIGERDFGMNRNATSQVTEYLGIPARFASRLESQFPDLLTHNLNEIIAKQDGRRMVRTMGDTARAFLSDSYRIIDNELVFDGLYPRLQRLGATIESANVSDDFLHLQATLAMEGEIRVGDVVRFGVAIRNSEIGRGALSVSPLLYRLACTNGMVIADQSRRKAHIGGSFLDNAGGDWIALSSETQMLKTRAIIAELGEYLEAMATPAIFDKTLARLRDVADQELPAEPTLVVESLAARYNLLKPEADSALLALAEGRDYTRWGLANAVTVLANTATNYDRAVELETLGGRIMQMPKSDYSALAKMPKSSEILEGELVNV